MQDLVEIPNISSWCLLRISLRSQTSSSRHLCHRNDPHLHECVGKPFTFGGEDGDVIMEDKQQNNSRVDWGRREGHPEKREGKREEEGREADLLDSLKTDLLLVRRARKSHLVPPPPYLPGFQLERLRGRIYYGRAPPPPPPPLIVLGAPL